GMDVARLLDREVALVDRAVARGREADLLGERVPSEEPLDRALDALVECRFDAVADEDGEADVLERLAELARAGLSPCLTSAEELPEIDRADPVLLVEPLGP